MFKALDTRTGQDVISLDTKWRDDTAPLRALGRDGALVCQGCRQPVLLRAGTKKRPHFAHKTLQNCPYEHASPRLLQARAVLYERLQREFGEAVTLEKSLEGVVLPRPVDCWVERPSGPLAYWIFEGGTKAQRRRELLEAFEPVTEGDRTAGAVRACINWVFLQQPVESEAEKRIELSPTERDFIQPSVFDQIGGAWPDDGHGSLHYLDPVAETLTTLRSLRVVHEPNIYAGRRERHALSDVLIAPKTGEFVHPGERERWKREREKREEVRRRKAQAKQREEERRQHEEAEEQQRRQKYAVLSEHWEAEQEKRRGELSSAELPRAEPVVHSPIVTLHSKVGTCVFCGQKTTEWYSYDGKTGECKCNSCLRNSRIS